MVNLSSQSSRANTGAGQILGGFSFLPYFLDEIARQADPRMINAFETFSAQPAFDAAQGALGAAQPLNTLAAPGAAAVREGLQTGFTPNVVQGLDAALRPSLERSIGDIVNQINEQAAAGGTFRSTGRVSDIGDASTDLTNQFLSTLGGAQTQAELGGQQIRGSLAPTAASSPLSLIQSALPLIQTALQSTQFGAQQPLAATAAVGSAAGSTPFFQQQQSRSKGGGFGIG